jgi:hypothetical protein
MFVKLAADGSPDEKSSNTVENQVSDTHPHKGSGNMSVELLSNTRHNIISENSDNLFFCSMRRKIYGDPDAPGRTEGCPSPVGGIQL